VFSLNLYIGINTALIALAGFDRAEFPKTVFDVCILLAQHCAKDKVRH